MNLEQHLKEQHGILIYQGEFTSTRSTSLETIHRQLHWETNNSNHTHEEERIGNVSRTN
jgi:hypothetical protein